MKFFEELKRRNVIKASLAYLVAAWVILQILSTILPALQAPEWVLRTLMFLIGFGFPIWVTISWVYEITPEGLKKTSNVPEDQSITEKTNKRLNILIIIGLITAIAVSFFNRSESAVFSSNNDVLERSIAVLPFDDMCEEDTQWFCDGITEDILTNLSRIKGIEKVISRTSIERYKETDKSIPEIAKELGVSYIVSGSVRKQNNEVQISAQLISANDEHLWADNYNESLEDVFKIQQDVSKKIVQQLQIVISPEEERLLSTAPTENIEAYKLYLKGRFYWHLRTKKGLNKSINYFNQALELDSTYALAYAGLADAYNVMVWWGFIPKNNGFDKGKEFAKKALSINKNLGEAHATLGGIATWYEWNWMDAEKELKHAISLNSNDAIAHQYYSELLDILGRNKEAREQINLALELNPYSLVMNSVSSTVYYNNFEYQQAIGGRKTAIDLADGNDISICYSKLIIIRCYLHLNKNEEVLDHIKEFISTDNPINDYEILDRIHKKSGIDGVVYWFINWLVESEERKYLHKMITIASFYGCIGDSQNTLKYLEDAFENGAIGMPYINKNSDFNFIQSEPRFIALLKKMNLAD